MTSTIWIDKCRARAHFSTSETHLCRQAWSESASEHVENSFGSASVERECISALRICVWDDRRRARAHSSTPDMHLGRQASSESAFQHSGYAFGTTGVERERISVCAKWSLNSGAPWGQTQTVVTIRCRSWPGVVRFRWAKQMLSFNSVAWRHAPPPSPPLK